MMDARYRTTIYAKTGKAYIIDIYTPEASTEGIEIIEGIPYDEPLTIEWDEQPKEAPLRPSRLTLKMISPADRSFIHLYAESPTEVMLTVREVMPDKSYRLIWLGWLDPEFYEEPFEQLDNYEVTFTFTDFAPLDRLEFNMDRGRHTLREYLTAALLAISPMEFNQPLKEYISTIDPMQPQTPILDALAVMGANFYDEDGSPLSWREVLEGILQPLGLCLIQRDGAFYLFDLNELYNSTELRAEQIYFTADSQTLSAEPIADKIKISFSTDGGFLIVEILFGLKVFNHYEVQAGEAYKNDVFAYGEKNLDGHTYWGYHHLYDYVRWMMYKRPALKILTDRKSGAQENTDDLCYLCWVNRAAKDSINIDTICGTATNQSPSAKGVFLNQYGTQISELKRGKYTNHPELLLAGTLYSQYNKSLTCLRGETCMYARGLPRFTSPHFPNTKFMIKSELQNLADDTSEMTFSEFRPDEYEQLKTQIHD